MLSKTYFLNVFGILTYIMQTIWFITFTKERERKKMYQDDDDDDADNNGVGGGDDDDDLGEVIHPVEKIKTAE